MGDKYGFIILENTDRSLYILLGKSDSLGMLEIIGDTKIDSSREVGPVLPVSSFARLRVTAGLAEAQSCDVQARGKRCVKNNCAQFRRIGFLCPSITDQREGSAQKSATISRAWLHGPSEGPSS